MDIHSKGGGIGYTVSCTRQATEEELYTSLSRRLSAMLKNGTTLVEAKSGYGLNKEHEVKMLKVIERARREHVIDVSSTYCGAHSIPRYNIHGIYRKRGMFCGESFAHGTYILKPTEKFAVQPNFIIKA